MFSCYISWMTGVSIEEWRGSIGRFNAFRTYQKDPVDRCNLSYFLLFTLLKRHLSNLKALLVLFFSLACNIILLFGFNLLVVFLMLLAVIHLGLLTLSSEFFLSGEKESVTLYLIFLVPKLISCSLQKYVDILCPMDTNIVLRLLVLCLLQIVVEIKTNPGPTSERNLYFAVWNLDSLPACGYARTPLIESFQAEYESDVFRVCESALSAGIPNDSILVDGFSPDPNVLARLMTPEMVDSAYITVQSYL